VIISVSVMMDGNVTSHASASLFSFCGVIHSIYWRGHVVATLCLMDARADFSFGPLQELQLEQIAHLMSQHIENWALQREMEKLDVERRLTQVSRPSVHSAPPEGRVALVFTDIQGSTRLWEANAEAMHDALQIHDRIMRQSLAENSGFEITTEGDAFQIAFHDSIDALRFALEAQQALHDAPWSKDILQLPDACDEGSFRGLRVRMAVHFDANVSHRGNPVSGRREYSGKAYHITKSLEAMAHGGQILVSSEAWKAASYLAESVLSSPQVVCLGTHVLYTGKEKYEGVIAMGVLQLVPASLSHNYGAFRTARPSQQSAGEEGVTEFALAGRQFPPPLTIRQMSPSFHDAPYKKNDVAMLFVYTSEIEKILDDPTLVLASVAEIVGELVGSNGPGYQCKNFMVAFTSTRAAVEFGLKLQKRLKERPVLDIDCAGLLQVGIHQGKFTSMSPNRVTGRADYFGKTVNRAARVAGAASPGDVCLGRLVSCPEERRAEPLTLGSEIRCIALGHKRLAGVDENMALYSCRRSCAVESQN